MTITEYVPLHDLIRQQMAKAREIKASPISRESYRLWVAAARRCNRVMLGLTLRGLKSA